MAVLQMQRISIYALQKDRREILEYLHRRGTVELRDLTFDDEVFEKTDTLEAKSESEKTISALNQALEILNAYNTEKAGMLASLSGRKILSDEEYKSRSSKREEAVAAAYRLIGLSKSIAENNAEILRIETQLDALVPWMPLQVSMQFGGTRTTAAFIGSFPEEYPLEKIYADLAQLAPEVSAVNVDVISQNRNQTCVFILAARKDAHQADQALRAMGFTRPSSPPKESPAEHKAILENRVEEARLAIQQAQGEIESFLSLRDSLRFAIDDYTMQAEKYDAISNLLCSKRAFILSGYIPARDAAALEADLTGKFEAAIELSDPGEAEDVPVALRNNKFVEAVEGVLESFSFPGKGEIDPSTLMAFFYYILFGLMLADAAYGLLMVIGCGWVLHKYKNMEDGMAKTIRMFYYCGYTTLFWGVMFGSYFGDVVDIVSQTFFHTHVTIPALWFAPINDPMRMLVFSMLIGIIHILCGLGAKFYQYWKAKRYLESLYDVVSWFVLVCSLIILALSSQKFIDILQLKFILPAAAGQIASKLALAAAVVIVLMGGRDIKNFAVRLLQGLYGLYNITGYLSDVLSYSRLLALGLASGVIGTVINKMAAMGGSGIVGVVMFILVFLFGHIINILINLLGAYVHTNRLHFIEFFGKFYEGGGQKFRPFAVRTKYYKFREETIHG